MLLFPFPFDKTVTSFVCEPFWTAVPFEDKCTAPLEDACCFSFFFLEPRLKEALLKSLEGRDLSLEDEEPIFVLFYTKKCRFVEKQQLTKKFAVKSPSIDLEGERDCRQDLSHHKSLAGITKKISHIATTQSCVITTLPPPPPSPKADHQNGITEFLM